jgi:RF-1 domain
MLTADQARQRLLFSDAQLLAECEVHRHRTGGPGGQHRNKVETAIRLVHKPTGLIGGGEETRSQHENKARALQRLRMAIAVTHRKPLESPPSWPDNARPLGGRLRVNESNPSLSLVIAIALDAVVQHLGNMPEAAAAIGVSTSSLARFLGDHPVAWAVVAQERRERGLPAWKL